jgi:hypothetical protein
MWQPFFGYVNGQAGNPGGLAGNPGTVCAASAAGNDATGELHLVVATCDGRLFHTIRYANGNWQLFGDIKGTQAGDPGSVSSVSAAVNNSTGELHVVVVASEYGFAPAKRLYHTIRHADGSWQPFGFVPGQDLYFLSDSVLRDVSAAVNNSTGELHLVVSTFYEDSSTAPFTITVDELLHTIRHADGGWDSFGYIARSGPGGQVADPGLGIAPGCWWGSGARVGTALVGGNLHVLASTQAGGLVHTIRYANGAWQPFGDVMRAAGDLGYVCDVSAAGNDATGELHVVAAAGASGNPWHTIRQQSTIWTRFENVTLYSGDPTSGWGYASVGTGLIQGSLHLVVVSKNAVAITTP